MTKDPSKYKWYQCNIIRKNGNYDFWCRFIAVNDQGAEERITTTLRKTLTGSIKATVYQSLAKHFIADFDIFRVPENILERYDFLKANEVDAFYRKAKG